MRRNQFFAGRGGISAFQPERMHVRYTPSTRSTSWRHNKCAIDTCSSTSVFARTHNRHTQQQLMCKQLVSGFRRAAVHLCSHAHIDTSTVQTACVQATCSVHTHSANSLCASNLFRRTAVHTCSHARTTDTGSAYQHPRFRCISPAGPLSPGKGCFGRRIGSRVEVGE